MKFEDVQIWTFNLEQPVETVVTLSRLLNEEEGARVDRFYFEDLKRRYIVRHGFMRMVLGDILELEPTALRFSHLKYGKPVLENRNVHFNLSSSGECAVLACARIGPLGVDVEEMRDMPDHDGVVKQFFSATEQRQWNKLSPQEKRESFFTGWTRKEAYIKALGLGLSLDLDSFSISFQKWEEAVQSGSEKQESWRLLSFQATPNHCACVALPDPELRVSFHTLTDMPSNGAF